MQQATCTPEFQMAMAGNKDVWVPAMGGTETPFISRSGVRLLYCYNPALGRHAYLDCANDIVLSDEAAFSLLQMF